MKKILLVLVLLAIVVGALVAVKFLQISSMIDAGSSYVPPPEPVNTAVVSADTWSTQLTATGSLKAVQAITVRTELPGKVAKIGFESGQSIEQGALLAQQETSSEDAELRAAEATLELARVDAKRTKQLVEQRAVARASLDQTQATLSQARAQADAIRVARSKKRIEAPFAGQLGLRQVNIGQVLQAGDPIVTLQTLDPIHVDFTLPQQQLTKIAVGQPIKLSGDVIQTTDRNGRITAIEPDIDTVTRAVTVRATVANSDGHLRPGMFVDVAVMEPTGQAVIAIPQTAVLYAPYGNSVFLVIPSEDDAETLVVEQRTVRLGMRRGDFVAVESGLEAGQTVVSSGLFKLTNGQTVFVSNDIKPDYQLVPTPSDG
ncbi:efflux RND transporter periplasmic adaptor subunit [Gammaproteobacteria bacterium]|nr:efflux RND transporter periplasmic adaptor subunit [Gammaproteobacteria bacterium]